jgi:hypothetical protein
VFLGSKVIRIVAAVLLSTALFGQQPHEPDVHFHSLIPLGAEAYELKSDKWKGMMTLMASAESPEFEGMVRRAGKKRDPLESADGTTMHRFPRRVSFRVTATFRSHFTDTSPFTISASGAQNDYLLKLQFRVVVFHGLRQTVIEPESVEMIGMPDEVPYDERIFRMAVNLSDVPVGDRVVLEVRDPEGGRICKFHLDLM